MKSEENSDPQRWVRWIVALCAVGGLAILAMVLTSSPSHANVFAVFRRTRFVLLMAAAYAVFWLIYFTVSRDTRRNKLGRFVLLSVAIVLTVGVLEILALTNLVDYPKALGTVTGFQTWQDSRWWKPDPELVYMRRPKIRITGKTTGDACYRIGAPAEQYYEMDVQYDSNGFRNPRDYEQADVVVIGDSFVEAGLVHHDQTMVGQLARLLDTSVVNLGVSAYGPQQELIVHRRYAMPLKPETVVWVFFEGNDLRDVEVYQYRKSIEDPEFTQETAIDRSFSWNALAATARLTSGWVRTGRKRRGEFTASGGAAVPLYFVYDGKPLTDEDELNLATTFKVIGEAHEQTQAAGARFLLVFAPTKFRVYDQLCEFQAAAVCRQWSVNDLPNRIADESRARGIEFLDLTPALREAAKAGEVVYWQDDTHWNERGNELAAKTLADRL